MQKMMGLVRRCIEDYNMIEAGDRVAVGVSGGKDSLTLLVLLAALREYYPVKFDLAALSVDMGLGGMDFSPVAELCARLNVPYLVKKTEIGPIIFDYRKEKIGSDRRQNPVHLFLDEAHRYIRKDAQYILRENIFEKIAREGRKYSLFLVVSSQRPSELSDTVLSQCSNFIVHRIQNEVDLKYVYAILPYFSEDFITKIKQSVPGEALIFGNCVPMPLQVQVIQAKPDPNSKNCDVEKEWFIKK